MVQLDFKLLADMDDSELSLETTLYCDSMTVQAPQPPSPQPSFVPHSPRVFLRYARRVVSGRALGSSTLTPKWIMGGWKVINL